MLNVDVAADFELRDDLANDKDSFDSRNAQLPTMYIKHMLYCRFLKCVLLNFVSNPAKRGAGCETKM